MSLNHDAGTGDNTNFEVAVKFNMQQNNLIADLHHV